MPSGARDRIDPDQWPGFGSDGGAGGVGGAGATAGGGAEVKSARDLWTVCETPHAAGIVTINHAAMTVITDRFEGVELVSFIGCSF